MKFVPAKNQYYNEIVQQIPIKFSFAKKEGDVIRQLFSWIKCRDFLGDCLYSKAEKSPFRIYGFSFDYTKTPLDTDATRMVLLVETEVFEENLHYLNAIEKDNNLIPSVLTKLQDNIYLIEGDVFWQKTTQLISFYTLIIKCMGVQHTESIWDNLPQNSNEQMYYDQIEHLLPTFEKHLYDIFKEDHGVSGFEFNTNSSKHNNSGIITFLDDSPLQWKLDNPYHKELMKWHASK